LSVKVRDAIKKIAGSIIDIYPPREAEQIGFLVLEHYYNVSKNDVLLNSDLQRGFSFDKIDHAILRLQKHEPVQYVLREAEFLGRKYVVNPNVLIPRSETEELVLLVKNATGGKKHLQILDIGTGSGCISIALADLFPDSVIYATDQNKEALIIARKNASIHEKDIFFIQDDIFLPTYNWAALVFDIIVSNPPYIADSEKSQIKPHVKDHEPESALFVSDEDPLRFYKALASFASQHMKKSGTLYLEINEKYGKAILELLKDLGFKQTDLAKDLHGRDRFVIARRS